eukprot:5383311-Ditylum_brightwellii.AAC.1
MRGHWHLWIGSQVWANRAASPEKALFIAVSQLNKGAMFLHDKDRRIELARLNLKAGIKSISLAAFAPAAFYLKTGIGLIDGNPWSDHYDLCLQLHHSYAEATYCLGKFDEMNKVVVNTFENARCFDDKLRSYITLVRAHGQNKSPEALKAGLHVLAELGEPIEISSDPKSMFMAEFLKTKQMLDGKTDDDISTMKKMDNDKKIAAVELMNILALYAYLSDQKLYPLIIFRIVQTSLSHGLCPDSAFGFASYGGLLSCVFHDIKGAFRFGHLSLHLLEKFEAKECVGRVYLVMYSLINGWIESHSASLEPLQFAYANQMRCGDIQYALMNARQYCTLLYYCGVELSIVEKACKDYGQVMMEHKHELFYKYTLPYRQASLNLMGRSKDPMRLTGEAMNQDALILEAMDQKEMTLVSAIYHQCSWLAYIFSDYKLAFEMIEKGNVIDTSTYPAFMISSYAFVEGLVSLALARETKEATWETLASKAIDKMAIYASILPSNFQHKLLLLQAESFFLSGDTVNASKHFDDAIKAAGENNFIQHQAVAYERAGIFHLSEGNTSLASQYYGQAHVAYLKWGAYCKADQLRLHCPF